MDPQTLAAILLSACRNDPQRPAIHLVSAHGGDLVIRRSDLIRGAAGVAQQLASVGIRPGDVVVLILYPDRTLIEWFFGTILHGAIPSILPFLTEKLQPGVYRRSLQALAAVTRPRAIACHPDFLDEVTGVIPEQAADPALILEVTGPASACDPVIERTVPQRQAEDVVLLQHSSGTTGLQKGVALSHQAVLRQLENYTHVLGLRDEDVVVSWLPLYHDMGLIAGFILPVLCGVPLVMISPFDWVRAPHRLFQAVSKRGGTLTWLPNFAYNFCAQKIRPRELEGVDLSSLRAVINCSEPIHWRSHELFLNRFAPYGLAESSLASCYAMAENVFAVTQSALGSPPRLNRIDRRAYQADLTIRPPSGDTDPLVHVSSGRPLANVEVRILDAGRQDLPDAHLGEIAIRSDCMLTEYYRRPDLTGQTFLEGWYLTGDLGYLDDGELFVTGRKKDLIIIGGKNIYPHDIEVLAGEVRGIHPGRIVAFGVFNEGSGTEDAVVVAESDTEEASARARLADEIRRTVTQGSDLALRYVEIVDRGWLIKTSSGKIARSANRAKYLERFRS